MAPTDSELGDALARGLAGSGPPPSGAPCPSDNQLAGHSTGALTERERDIVSRHLGDCATCRRVLADLAELGVHPEEGAYAPAAAVSSSEPAAAGRRPRLRLLAVATVAASVAAGALLLLGLPRGGPAARDTDGRLVALAADLARSDPATFSGFAPLAAAERERVEPTALRGGPAVRRPAGRLRDGRPEVEAAVPPAATAHEVTIIDADGTSVLAQRTTAMPFPYPADAPALPPGAYVVEVKSIGPAGSTVSRRAFEVVSGEERRRHEAARAAIEKSAPADLRALLLAHFDVRRGFLLDALEAAAEAARALPDDPAARSTLLHVRLLLGDPEAPADPDEPPR